MLRLNVKCIRNQSSEVIINPKQALFLYNYYLVTSAGLMAPSCDNNINYTHHTCEIQQTGSINI